MVLMKRELIAGLNTPSGLETALQQAVMLEHSTIPPYLYALYSLAPGRNSEIAELISSVVAEEMAHMALACNILNAIGGSPSIDDPAFVPHYPGPLPGTVEKQLTVPLAPFSPELLTKVFMVIEQPEEPHEYPDAKALLAEEAPLTIGAFYTAIQKQIEAGGESLFTGDPAHQVYGGIALKEVIPVHDVHSAATAIELIIEQGEGTSTTPTVPLAEEEELAHYYRFAEIVHGRKLVPAPNQEPPWAYAGETIPYDPGGVLPALENPTPASYPAESAARYAFDTFNYTYTSLLKALHETFNGQPEVLNAAVGLMESLNEQAKALMSMSSGVSGKTAGPNFEYRPTNP
ncbi:MAG: ferritin-like domain-containing protein [Solirubrobacterales bacterium]